MVLCSRLKRVGEDVCKSEGRLSLDKTGNCTVIVGGENDASNFEGACFR